LILRKRIKSERQSIMITTIRRSFKTRAYKIMLWTIFLAMTVGGGLFSLVEVIRMTFFGAPATNWVLQVNKHTITAPEFMRAVADQEERIRIIRSQYGQYADLYFQMMGMKLDPVGLATKSLIGKTLINEAAAALPVRVNAEAARAQLNNPMFISQEISDLVPFFTWDHSLGGINPVMLHQYHQQIGVTTQDFERELIKAVKRNDLKQLVDHGSYIPEFELKKQFAQNYQGHKFSIMTITEQSIQDQLKKQPATTDALKSYYDLKNTQERRYYVPEKRSVKIVTFDPATYGITVTDEQVESYYNNNKAQFIEQPAQVQVRHILLKVSDSAQDAHVREKAEAMRQELMKAPATFAAKAKEVSEDTKTAAQGGTMPFFAKGTHDKNFEKTAFLLKEDGAISDLVRTGQGYEILQRIGKKAQTFKPLASVSKDIKESLRKKKFAEQFGSDVRRALAQSNPKASLESFIKEHAGKETGSKEITADNSILAKTAFRLKENETSFYQDPTQGVVVTVAAIKPTFTPSFEEVKAQVTEDYYKEKAHEVLLTRLEELKKPGAFQASLKTGPKTEPTGWLKNPRTAQVDDAEIKALMSKGLDLGKMFQLENINSVMTQEQGDKGFVVRLDDIEKFDPAAFQEKKNELLTDLERQKKSLLMAGFVASLYRNAKINKNESLIRTEQ